MSAGVTGIDRPVASLRLYLVVENNNRHLRGKKRAIDAIVQFVLPVYGETWHLQRNEYQIKIGSRLRASGARELDVSASSIPLGYSTT